MQRALIAAGVVAMAGSPAAWADARGAEGGAPARPGDDTGFAIATDGKLYAVNLSTATATPIGPTGVTLDSLARRPSDGALFAGALGAEVYSVDPATGAATLIGSNGLGAIESLDFSGDVLLGTSFDPRTKIFAIDQTNGSATFVVEAEMETGLPRALAAIDSATVLVNTQNFGLMKMSLVNGALTPVGPMGFFSGAMDFGESGTLYAMDDVGNVHAVNPDNGSSVLVGNTGNHFWAALAAGPIGGPPPCYADFDQSGALNIYDFLLYLNAFNSADPKADCDENGVLNLFDFLCFSNAFNTGC